MNVHRILLLAAVVFLGVTIIMDEFWFLLGEDMADPPIPYGMALFWWCLAIYAWEQAAGRRTRMARYLLAAGHFAFGAACIATGVLEIFGHDVAVPVQAVDGVAVAGVLLLAPPLQGEKRGIQRER